MKPVDVKDNTYIDFFKKFNDKNPKFKVGDHVIIWKYKNIFAKGICQIGQKKYSLLNKLKILYQGHMSLITLMVKKLLVPFMKMNCKAQVKKNSEKIKYLRKKVISYM